MKSFGSDMSHTEMLPKTGAMLTALEKDPTILESILSQFSKTDQLRVVHDRFHASFNEAMGGDPEKVSACETARQRVDKEFGKLVGLVKLAAEDDPTLLKKLGLDEPHPPVKRTPVSNLAAPADFKLRHGDAHGLIMGKCKPVKGARSYDVEVCEGDPTVEANWRHHCIAALPSKIELKGLVPGKVYWFRIRAVGGNRFGPWSAYATLMAI